MRLASLTTFLCALTPGLSSDLLDRWYDFLSTELSDTRLQNFEVYVFHQDADFTMFDAVNGLYVSEQDAAYFPDVKPCDFECVFNSFAGFHQNEEHIRDSWEQGSSPEEKEQITEFFKNIHGKTKRVEEIEKRKDLNCLFFHFVLGTSDWESVLQFAVDKNCPMDNCIQSLMPQFRNEGNEKY